MSALELIARRAARTRGIRHLTAIQALRDYIRESSDEELIKAINRITDMTVLRTLIEAGLRRPLLDAVIARTEELIRRRTAR